MELNSLDLNRRRLREEFELFAKAENLPEGAAANDIRVVNAYRSGEAFRREFVISDPLPARQQVTNVDEDSEEEELEELEDEVPPDRETAMYRLVSRELVLPDDKDPEVALQRAVELAKSERYQRHRRRLYEYIDGRMARNASRYSDRIVIEDEIAAMSELERNEFRSSHVEFANVFGKAFVSAMVWELPSIASGLMEFVGYLTKSEGNAPDGPFAMFHDVKKMFRKRG